MNNLNKQKELVSKVRRYIMRHSLIKPKDHVVVAMSGGADSTALFYILMELQGKMDFELSACHYNHRLRGQESLRDQEFVQKICSSRGVAIEVGERPTDIEVKNELDARELRLQFFGKIFSEKGGEGVKIALAHNSNDFAETYLMRLVRGSGLKGLSSILPQRDFLIRPLLSSSREEIIDYLSRRSIEYCSDSSNGQNVYTRNKIRNIVLPELKKINPKVISSIAATAQQAASDSAVIQSQVEAVFKKIAKPIKEGYQIPKEEWQLTDPLIRGHIIHYWANLLCPSNDVSREQIEKILEIIENNIGEKKMPLPHSLRFELKSGRIYMYK